MPESKFITIGMTVGKLLVLGRAYNKKMRPGYLCRCECGVEKVVEACALRTAVHNKAMSSCGCHKRRGNLKHGHASNNELTLTYRTWRSMVHRCCHDGNRAYRYRDRGIKICERWMDYANFLEDMGERPQGHSIDRIDNDGNYEPGNCRWADPAEQARNRRSNIIVTYDGQRMCLLDFARAIGMNDKAVRGRWKSGWSAAKIAATPIRTARLKTTAQIAECARP